MLADPSLRPRRTWSVSLASASMLCISTLAGAAEKNNALQDQAVFFSPFPVQGQEFSQIFSRTISTRVEGFDSIARRISGTGSYRMISLLDDRFTFETKSLYDGRPLTSGITKIRRDGGESCWQDKCGPATDASGLFFNVLLWGAPPKRVRVGTRWHTKIPVPWELGPAGEEEVTVTALDASTGSVTLLRQGSGEGLFDNDPAQIKLTKDGKEYTLDCKPGAARWSGYTTIAKGIIINDELLVERTLLLSSTELGILQGIQRQYILLSKMPQSSSWEGA